MTDNDVRRIEDKVDNVGLVLAELRGSLSPTLQKLAEKQEDLEEAQRRREDEVDRRFEKAEVRLTALERFRYSVPSLAVLALLLDVIIGVYYLTHPH